MKQLSSTGTANFVAAVSMLVLAILSVALRIAFRLCAKQRLTISDVLIGLSLLPTSTFFAFLINYLVYGPGPGSFSVAEMFANLDNGGLEWGRSFLKATYFTQIFFVSSIAAVKLSVLAFYHQTLGISIPFRRFNYFMVGAVLFFWLLFALICTFQCHPIDMLWNGPSLLPSAQYCMSKTQILFSFDFTNLSVDIVILSMPPAMISRLQLSKKKKWSACGVLLLGGSVCITSILRLTYIWNPDSEEIPEDLSAMQITADVELGVATLCACLPSYALALRLFGRRLPSLNRSIPKRPYECELRPRGTERPVRGDRQSSTVSFNDNQRLVCSSVV